MTPPRKMRDESFFVLYRLAKKPTVTTVGHEQATIAALWSQQRHFWEAVRRAA